jgi:hypothetical protein
MSKRDDYKYTRLYPKPPTGPAVNILENKICEDNAYAERMAAELTDDAASIMVGLTSDQRKYYHVRGTKLYLSGIQEGLRLLLGDEQAELFMKGAKAKHEKVQQQRAERRALDRKAY